VSVVFRSQARQNSQVWHYSCQWNARADGVLGGKWTLLSKRLKLKVDYLLYSIQRTHLEARKTVIAADDQRRLLDGHPDTIIFQETVATPTPSRAYNKSERFVLSVRTARGYQLST